MNEHIPIFGQKRRRRKTSRVVFLALCLTVVLVLVGGFVQFVNAIPVRSAVLPLADGIVVLTGGPDRIGDALTLLEQKRGARLLISGVNEQITREELAAQFGDRAASFECCVDLGFRATSTIGNAAETAEWAAGKGYGSLIVVTSDYHMPRSLALLSHAMPEVELKPYPVPHSADPDWTDPAVARVLVSEYAKFLVTVVRNRLS